MSMALRTVKVPPGMESLFEQAERVVSLYFSERRDQPERGSIEIQGERYVLLRAASLSVEFFLVVRELLGGDRRNEADEFARNILFDLAHAVGRTDAARFAARMGLDDPMARLSAGPVHFAHAGWASVDISPDSRPSADEDYYLRYDHPYSFESDAWIQKGEVADFPVCVMNAGYSSGWCEESFGLELVATEVFCRAREDDCCRFIMAPPQRIQERVSEYLSAAPGRAERSAGYRIPDLFARKRLEDELRAARDELELRVEERTEELQLANERLEREMRERSEIESKLLQSHKLESLGRLAGGIAHDFNNLLMAIGGCSELILEDLAPDHPHAELAADIAHATERAARLTGQLLMFSRTDTSSPEVLDLGVAIAGMSQLLERVLGEQVELDFQVEGKGNHVRLEPMHVQQIVLNLSLNARDAMPQGGRLELSVSRRTREPEAGGAQLVVLTARDQGTGMDEETLSRLFDPFYTTKPVGQGTGLGLATVHGVVRQAGGEISVESRPGKGSTFELVFPLAKGKPARPPVGSVLSEPVGGTACVLLVEDEASVRRLMELVLKRRGCQVLSAGTPAEARAHFEAHGQEIDLLLTDVALVGGTGPDLAVLFRQERPELRVLFVSGHARDGSQPQRLGQPEDLFLQKPFTLGRFAEAVESVLRE
jgi:signal transduction histidine kinase